MGWRSDRVAAALPRTNPTVPAGASEVGRLRNAVKFRFNV